MFKNPELKKLVLRKIAADASSHRQARIKMARHLLNMHELEKEMGMYNLSGLQKAASAGTHFNHRIKYAALQAQHTIEKQSFLRLWVKERLAGPSAGTTKRTSR